jgi:hypothetical protein
MKQTQMATACQCPIEDPMRTSVPTQELEEVSDTFDSYSFSYTDTSGSGISVTTVTGRDLLLIRLKAVFIKPRYDIPEELKKRAK